MTFLTSSEIVSLEKNLNEVDPRLCGDPAMLAAMALRLDTEDAEQADVRARLCYYIAFRWPNLQRDLTRSLTAGELRGALLKDAKQRKARGN